MWVVFSVIVSVQKSYYLFYTTVVTLPRLRIDRFTIGTDPLYKRVPGPYDVRKGVKISSPTDTSNLDSSICITGVYVPKYRKDLSKDGNTFKCVLPEEPITLNDIHSKKSLTCSNPKKL